MAEFKTHGERMQAKTARFFTGREEQLKAFERALLAVEKEFEPPYDDAKIWINVSGEGGIGKTWLCLAFQRLCKQKEIESIYIDMSRRDEPRISNLIHFMKILRRRFADNREDKLLGQEPFKAFDDEYARYLGLEEKLRQFEEKKSQTAEMIEQASEMGARVAVGLAKDLPFGQTATEWIGEERIERAVKSVVAGGIGLTRDLLLRAFGRSQDVDFYLSPEETLIKKFAEGVKNYGKRKPLALLLDTYEEAMHLDRPLRERLLELFPPTVIFVFAGRNSIYDNCNPAWREDTHFFELREFDQTETESFLRKKGLQNEALMQAVFNFTHGVPLAVGLACDAVKQVGDEQAAIAIFGAASPEAQPTLERRRIIEEMAERFLSLVPQTEQDLINACVVLGQFNRPYNRLSF